LRSHKDLALDRDARDAAERRLQDQPETDAPPLAESRTLVVRVAFGGWMVASTIA
jgi:hypothetical protein